MSMSEIRKAHREWSDAVKAKLAVLCKWCPGAVKVELITRCAHYAGIICTQCQRHNGWLPSPPKTHAAAWDRKRAAEESVPKQADLL